LFETPQNSRISPVAAEFGHFGTLYAFLIGEYGIPDHSKHLNRDFTGIKGGWCFSDP
jgi:hypothetical protein